MITYCFPKRLYTELKKETSSYLKLILHGSKKKMQIFVKNKEIIFFVLKKVIVNLKYNLKYNFNMLINDD